MERLLILMKDFDNVCLCLLYGDFWSGNVVMDVKGFFVVFDFVCYCE